MATRNRCIGFEDIQNVIFGIDYVKFLTMHELERSK
jgi:hypothetical protein